MTESRDVFFHVGDLVLFPFVLFHLVFFEFGSRLDVLVEVSRVDFEFFALHVDDVGAYSV